MIASGRGSTLLAVVSVPYRIRRSDRARRIRVSVDNDGQVEVVLPSRSPERHAEDAVRQLGPWIERRKRAVARAVSEMEREAGTVPYLGETLRLVPEAGRERVHRRGDELLVPVGDPSEALERWYRRQARLEIAPRLDAATARAGTTYTGLTIRGQRTRWASRSSSGGMSFNWRLLLAPPEILDYVVEHEVAHIEVMDHSPRFWRLLASRSPRWREHSAWLKRYGSTLTL
jgi:predicted metal-dependent hydrolase